MFVVASSVFILFALIFLGFYIGKRGIVRKECTPDLSNFVLKVAMPATVFLSIVGQDPTGLLGDAATIIVGVCIMHAVASLIGIFMVKILPIPDTEKGVWIYTCMLSNNGFMGLPLALSVYGDRGMFLMAVANVITNLLIFSIGIKFITWKYPVKEEISLKKMFINNINIAVVLGFIFLLLRIPVPDIITKLLTYVGNITSGMSMIVVGLSLSRLPFKAVFEDKKMFILTALRLLILPLLMIVALKVIPINIDDTLKGVLILTTALPASSAQSMIAEQYGANTAATGRAVFITTLFCIITVPIIMIVGL